MFDQASQKAGPLCGVRVLEFGQIAAGPFTGSLLADLGADVVKAERPDGGDGMRGCLHCRRLGLQRKICMARTIQEGAQGMNKPILLSSGWFLGPGLALIKPASHRLR